MKYFVDSSYIVALIKEDDSLHEKSLEFLNLLDSNDCYINNSVLAEILNISNKYTDFANVIEIYYQLFDNFTIINEFDIFAYDARTLVEFEKYKGKLGFVDSGIITTMNQHQITNLVTFDKEFKKVKSINVLS